MTPLEKATMRFDKSFDLLKVAVVMSNNQVLMKRMWDLEAVTESLLSEVDEALSTMANALEEAEDKYDTLVDDMPQCKHPDIV